jgi:hypothetical protein
VYRNDKVLASFEFLDEALAAFPSAQMVPMYVSATPPGESSLVIPGAGTLEQTAYRPEQPHVVNDKEEPSRERLQQETWRAYEALLKLCRLTVASRNSEASLANYLADTVGKLRFLEHSEDSIQRNFDALVTYFHERLGISEAIAKRSILVNFPQLCLYRTRDVVERIQFLLAPLPPKNYATTASSTSSTDWPLLASQGYGAGWTVHQVDQAIRAIPHILALYLEDAAAKPSWLYFHQALRVPYEKNDEARMVLGERLVGVTMSDVAMMAYLNSALHLSWEQIKILLEAFPTLVVCEKEPTWELVACKGPLRSVLEQSVLNYLQMRLQIYPGQVLAMIKTHSRLSSYSLEGNIQPTIDAVQTQVGLSSRETRKILLRMPSIIGTSTDGLTKRIMFFRKEGKLASEAI